MNEPGRAKFSENIRYCLEIAKIPLCLLVGFTALFGYVFANQAIGIFAFAVFISVFLLACGGASFNSYQERKRDGLMKRTNNRPLVQGSLTAKQAIIQSITLVIIGLAGLFIYTNIRAFIAGLIGILIYNLVYTRLKPYSIHAIIPGAICGAVPPYIGWLAANGEFVSVNASLPVLLLIFWQIPHFFLVLLNHKNDYIDSYSPNMLKKLTEPVLQRIFLPWITALAATMLTFSVIPSKLGGGERTVIVVNAVILIGLFYGQLLFAASPNYKGLFRYLNFSIFLLMLVVCIGVSGISE